MGVAEILRLQPRNPLPENILRAETAAVGQGRQHREFIRRVDPLHIVSRIRLGVPQALRLGQRLIESPPVPRHPAEDIIGSAVDDCADGINRVGGKFVHQAAHDGNAAAHAGLEQQTDLAFPRQRHQFRPVFRHHFLIGRNHVLARRQRPPEIIRRRIRPAHHLDHNIDFRVVQKILGIGGHHPRGQVDIPPPGDVAHQRPAQTHRPPHPGRHRRRFSQQRRGHAAAYHAQPHKPHIYARIAPRHRHYLTTGCLESAGTRGAVSCTWSATQSYNLLLKFIRTVPSAVPS